MNSRHIEVCHITERNHQLMHLFNRLYCENIFALMKEKVFFFNIKIYFRNKSKLVIKQPIFCQIRVYSIVDQIISSMHVWGFFLI